MAVGTAGNQIGNGEASGDDKYQNTPTSATIAMMAARLDFYERVLPTREYLDYVRAHRLDIRAAGGFAGVCGVVPVVDCGGFRFELSCRHDNSSDAFICEAFDVDGETVIDLVAWPLDRPAHVLSMFGRASMFGLWEAMNPGTYFMGGVLTMHRTPLDWLKAGCAGAAIVDPYRAARAFLDIPGKIAAQDHIHGRALAALAQSVVDRDRFVVRTQTMRAAA